MLNNWAWQHLHLGTGKPYLDIKKKNNTVIRIFPSNTPPHTLKWHMDDEDRLVTSLNKNNWLIQLDNELPASLNKSIFITKHKWHRLHKGDGHLVIIVKKYAKRA